MRTFILLLILSAGLTSNLLVSELKAQLEFTGDAKIRPRWDLNDQTGAGRTLSRDLYTIYRTRIRMQADVGDGWKFKTMLGHNGAGEFAGKFAKGELPDILGVEQTTISNDGARRSTVDFMELYIHYKTDKKEFKAGLFPVGSTNNPVYDMHYYPLRMIDIPFTIFNNGGIYGMYYAITSEKTKWSASIYVDDDRGGYIRSASGSTLKDENDQYTLEVSAIHKTGQIQWVIQSLYTFAADSISQPLSISVQSKGWKLGQLDIQYQAMYSKQAKDEAISNDGHFGLPMNPYTAYFFRLRTAHKFGSNRLCAWLDFTRRVDDLSSGDVNHTFAFMWIDYAIQLAKTDNGLVVLTPRIRPILHRQGDITLQSRQKFELDLDIFF